MREDHKGSFFRAAEEFQCWIGVREPNPMAEKWIGRAGYVAKSEECKAKTADNPRFAFAGLVTDPIVRNDAFTLSGISSALESWRKFLTLGKLPPGFSRIESGNERGLIKFRGCFIHADYDLMAINRSNSQGEWLPTSREQQKYLFDKIQPELNRGFHNELIQHGPEFDWDEGVGAKASEMVLWFGPGRRFNRWPSSMPKGGH